MLVELFSVNQKENKAGTLSPAAINKNSPADWSDSQAMSVNTGAKMATNKTVEPASKNSALLFT